MMSSEQEEQFVQFERSIGISQENFASKFIFQRLREKLINATNKSDTELQNLLDLGHSNLYLQLGSTVQADIDGFSKQQQILLHFYGASIISDACQYLQLPITTCISAQTIFHRFYTRCSFLKHDLRDIAMGAVFLAGKAQETIKKPRDISYVFDQIFKIEDIPANEASSSRPVNILDDKSAKFNTMKSVVQEMERQILKELGFELYQITWSEQPHRLMYFYINLFKPTKNAAAQQTCFQNLTRLAFNYLNDSYRTNVCTYFPFSTILASCIYLAFRQAEQPMPKIAWWTIMETSLQNLRLAAAKILAVQSSVRSVPKYSNIHAILSAQAQINGFKHFKISLPYHEMVPIRMQTAGYTMNSLAEAIAKSKNGRQQSSSNYDNLNNNNNNSQAVSSASLSSSQANIPATREESNTTSLDQNGSMRDMNNKSKFSRQNGNGVASPSEKSSHRKHSPSVSLNNKHSKRRSRSRSSHNHHHHRDRKEKDSKSRHHHHTSSSRRSRSKDKKQSSQYHGKKSSKSPQPVDSRDRKRRTSEERRRSRDRNEDSTNTSVTSNANTNASLRSRGTRDSSRSRSKSQQRKSNKHRHSNHSPDDSRSRKRNNSRDRKKYRRGSSSSSSSRSRSRKPQQPKQSSKPQQQEQQQQQQPSQSLSRQSSRQVVSPQSQNQSVTNPNTGSERSQTETRVNINNGSINNNGYTNNTAAATAAPSPPIPAVISIAPVVTTPSIPALSQIQIIPPPVVNFSALSVFQIESKPSNSIQLGLAFDSTIEMNKQKEQASQQAAAPSAIAAAALDSQKKKDLLESIKMSIRQKSGPVITASSSQQPTSTTTITNNSRPISSQPIESQTVSSFNSSNQKSISKPELELSKIKNVIASATASAMAARSQKESSEDAALERLRLMREQTKMKEESGR